MKQLSEILKGIHILEIIGLDSIMVVSLILDSRKVTASSLFIALKGTQADGHIFISKAVEQGASVIVCEEMPSNIPSTVTVVRVNNTTEVVGLIASAFYDNPSEELKVIGVTGTNGKTTTVTELYHLFRKAGYKTGLISTVIYYVDDIAYESTHTTPDAIQIQKLMREMLDVGCDYCFMEVSSHAIDQKRINGIRFSGGVFSNLTHDHLDYHKTFDEYLKVKKRFFDLLPSDAFALVNIDDRNGRVMVQNTKAKVKTYALKSMADFTCRIIEKHLQGMMLRINHNEVWVHFIGDFNGYNLLAIYTTAILLGIKEDDVMRIISELKPVHGRFETLYSPGGIAAIVDYAHTPDALINVLDTINNIMQDKTGKVISVVGAGGNRDKLKRPKMARISADRSDHVILTSDNPRNERPEDILADMQTGLNANDADKVITISDRREAIKTAVMLATKGDIILVAGKGHETYQEIQGVKHHFDDKEILEELLKNK